VVEDEGNKKGNRMVRGDNGRGGGVLEYKGRVSSYRRE
jgi:hypothetical protein